MLHANRGPAASVVAPGYLELRLATPGLPDGGVYRVQLVNSSGRQVWSGASTAHNGEIQTPVTTTVESGQHWVRVFGNGQLIQEYGLAVR